MMARQLVETGKGLLAADESLPSIARLFRSLGIPSTEETRLAYRDMLLTSPDIEEYISGVILFDETIRQKTRDGTSFVELLERRGIVPGIKVDKRGCVQALSFYREGRANLKQPHTSMP